MSSPLVLLMLIALGQSGPEAPPAANPVSPPPTQSDAPEDPATEDPVALPPRRPIVRPFQMPVVLPTEPVPYAAPGVSLDRPVTLDDYHRSYEPPPDAIEAYYDKGVRSAFAAEQSLMGPLDGQWTLKGPDGVALFTVLLNDPGEVTPLDGAWRDLRPGRQGAGLLDSADRDGEVLVLMLREGADGRQTVIRLQSSGDGRWRGEIHDPGGGRRTVSMSRS